MKRVTLLFIAIPFLFLAANSAAEEPQQKTYKPKKVEVDSDYNGKIDRVEYYNSAGQVDKVELDTDENGKTDEWIIYKDGKPSKSERDTNADGKPDIWLEY